MGKRNFDGIRICMAWAATCLCLCGRGQTISPPKIESPNVASLEKFGEVPVDLSTGTPNITIPIHTLHYGNISVPISLRYHPASLRIAQHEGWVGAGWDLESGGAITRKINWMPDELYGQYINGDGAHYFSQLPPAGNSGSEVVNNNENWNTIATLGNYFSVNGFLSFGTDYCADEFSFNFMGYSGKFYYEGPAKGWQVVCDQNVLVQLTNPSSPFLSPGGVISTIDKEYPVLGSIGTGGHLNNNYVNSFQSYTTQVFSGFTLTVPDGTKYYFGGMNDIYGTGIEFYGRYTMDGVGDGFGTNTWLLTKIVDADNNQVDFQYSADYPTADLGFGYFGFSGTCSNNTSGPLNNYSGANETSGKVDVHQLSGTLNLPLYLDRISCSNETVTFNHSSTSPTQSLRFPNGVYDYIDFGGTSGAAGRFPLDILFDKSGDGNGGIVDGATNLQWEQLNSIIVKNSNGQVFRQYALAYSSDPSLRLTLLNFSEIDNTANSVKKYSFAYNTPFPATALYDGNYTDHWGFYNGTSSTTSYANNPNYSTGAIFANKTTNSSLVLNGLLNTIYYPTGGKTVFFWQPHDFSQIVSTDRQSLTGPVWPSWAPPIAGGSRIGEVKSYLADGSLALGKKFFYLRGYSNANPNGLASSGILNGSPSYYFQLQDRLGFKGTIIENINAVSLNSFANYSYSSNGSFIGYDEVVEMDADNSYTKNFFTSYGPDLNGISHFDRVPSALGWQSTKDSYFPMNTLNNERGKPICVQHYNPNDVLVQKEAYIYRNDEGRFNNYARLVDFNNSYSQCGSNHTDALILATANQKYTYDYYVTNRSVTNYDQLGKNPITTSTSFQYNANNLVSVKTETDSKGETLVTSNTYTTEATDATSLAMANAHILTPIVQVTMARHGAQVSVAKTDYYSPHTDMYKPQTLQVQVGSNQIEPRQQFYGYDIHGNINEMAKDGDTHEVFLWGYNGQYPVAKITGSTYGAVTAIVSQAQIDGATAISNNDVNLRSLLKSIQTGILSASVSYYTYLPLTGITSETNPRGKTTYYQYDTFQRLQLIKDHQGSILKTFNYQYQIPL